MGNQKVQKIKRKVKNAGVGVDFKRVKHKVGKKLPRAKNETNTDFTSKSINLPSQAVKEDRSGVAVNYQNLTLKELLNQTSHHNDKSRKHSLVGLSDLFGRHPEHVRLHAAQVLATLAERIVDGDPGVRSELRRLLGESVLPVLGADALRPFMPMVMAHVCGAMTHLSLDVRQDALLFLDILMDHVPRLVVDGYLAPCLAHFCDLFSASHRSRSIRAQSLAALTKLLTALSSFLRRAFPSGGAGPDGGSDAADAGPGPSSTRQAALQAAAAATGPLGSDRTRWPARSGAELLAGLDGLFRAAAAATRAGRGKKGPKLGASDGVDKNRSKKGRGSVSTSEAFMSSADAAAAANAGKSIAAAAAALAAVAAAPPAAAAAAAPSGADLAATAASGVLATGTAMAAALVAASDARASALRLVSLLMDCWAECAPGQLASAPEAEQAAAVLMVLAATNTLIEKLLLPPLPTGGGGAGASAGSAEGQLRLQLLQHLHDLVAKRVTGCFPTTSPPVKPAAVVADTLVRINLQTAELLCRFLPLLAHQPPQAQAPAQQGTEGGPLQWVPSLVGYYVGVLEDGVLLPAAAGTLAEAPAATAGLSGGASEGVLAAVAAAVQSLDAGSAQRLMGAVASFASRQTARSTARVASIRMQHGLLRAALAGRLYLEDGVVAGWLVPLPKLLWEVGGGAPEASTSALQLMMDAARFAAPGSSIAEFLVNTLQPQLAPLFAAQLPPKAAKAAIAKHKATGGAAADKGPAVAAAGGPLAEDQVMVLLPGVVSKLPEHIAAQAVDLLYHTGALGAPLLKPLAAVLSCAALPRGLALRLLDVVLSRLRDAPDPALAASWLLSLLFGPQHGLAVLGPDGADLTADWGRQRATLDAAVMGMGRLGGAGPLLQLLLPQVAALPLEELSGLGAPAPRVQRYSLVCLAGAAVADAAGAGATAAAALPKQLVARLPAVAALCGLELAAQASAEVGEEGALAGVFGGGAGSNAVAAAAAVAACGPVLQLLQEQPSLAVPLLQTLAEVVEGGVQAAGGKGGAEAGAGGTVGRLQLHLVALAALRLAQASVKLQPVRTTHVAAKAVAQREALVAAATRLTGSVKALPASVGASERAAACVVESQRLSQTMADLYASA
ncbi:hypothetical protein HYH02_006229 [Chlamydomonas schloesseri]|uniref:Pre-rRNA-processing protein Ipi1 N-terminal domain-containing protein n=1 Tax=Chlamydomonas schloesseri TaxID=2026947 RepID=A0A836B6E6_9CHLO|nr:hypothetical protein HYH02_006229 [Chlamydomonas schloesseri]|eukprot:KAG2448880.1 hypothetical protein HYH02_006229 [Chlamydomonas schloesseri]